MTGPTNIQVYSVSTQHFDEDSGHHGYFKSLDNAIKKAMVVLEKEQEELLLMREFDKGISGLYDEDFKEVPIHHEHILWEMKCQTRGIIVSTFSIVTEY